jgi:hypothetical protein
MVERDRETVVVTDTGDRGGGGAVLAVVLLLAIALILFLIFGTNMLDGVFGGGGAQDIKVDVNVPGGGSGK